jgi:NTP pyrophosphatase (non-canonical NTP hydrolase)
MVSDGETKIAELKEKVRKFNDDRHWAKYHNPKDIAISIAIEASELMELFQWVKDSQLDEVVNDPDKLARLEAELADIVIYCLGLANTLGIDISRAVLGKLAENEARYPVDEVKGNYRKYTEVQG